MSSTATNHHLRQAEVAPGIWFPARPARDTSWWHRWKRERACSRELGHCWHPEVESLTDWYCCSCGGGTEGMPPQRCAVCVGEAAGERFVKGFGGTLTS